MNRKFSRRSLLNLAFLREEKAPEIIGRKRARQRPALLYLRPPKAIEESQFLERCTGCDDCAAACPFGAIVKLSSGNGAGSGTPIINPSNAACAMCEDMPCVVACREDALLAEMPAKMGTALIQKHDCLAWSGSFCSSCAERCPVPEAIRLEAGKPIVEDAVCTGCGICHYVCPAPQNAVMILPERSRKAAPGVIEATHE